MLDHRVTDNSSPVRQAPRRRRAAFAATLTLALLGGAAAATPAVAAPEPGFETLTPVCSPQLPIVHPGCVGNLQYKGAPLPSGTPNQTVQLSGDDRYATAVEVARHGFPEADVAVLVSGEAGHLVDALSTAPLARSLAAPVLLARRGSIPAATADYLRSTGVDSVLIVGGTSSLDAGTADRLRELGVTSVGRVEGANRYATSRAVAALMPNATHAWVASGEERHLVDALASAGPAARLAEPLVLVDDNDPIPVGDLLRSKGVTSTTVAGGPAGVAPEALAALPAPERAEGENRYETALELAGAGVDRGVEPADLVLVAGLDGNLVDALASGPLGRSTLLVGESADSMDIIEAWFDVFGAGRTTAVGAVELAGGTQQQSLRSLRLRD
ncbi:cell wall-binding repeat-containing protein [Kineococcus gynurae]|uniref:Cell wall-binding repeat-containing protein n=1 Tax=Kineococcus gynurae TaxID=452979 RepID=A0ABV5LTU4_9ACTN